MAINNMLTLENNYIAVDVDEIYGGKITRLENKISKYDWVWFDNKKSKEFKPLEYSDYDSQWIGGYEELFPNDKIENLDGSLAPDHGELWSSTWQVINSKKDYLHLQCKGYFSNSTINKIFELNQKKIKVSYKIDNIKLTKYLFKLHLAMPINNSNINIKFDKFKKVDENFGNIILSDDPYRFLNNVSKNQSSNDFAYFYGNDGVVEVIDGNNKFSLSYDNISLPYFWIFQSRGGWNNLNVNVLEPCNAGLKDIEDAYFNNLLLIPSENKFSTWYEVQVSEI